MDMLCYTSKDSAVQLEQWSSVGSGWGDSVCAWLKDVGSGAKCQGGRVRGVGARYL